MSSSYLGKSKVNFVKSQLRISAKNSKHFFLIRRANYFSHLSGLEDFFTAKFFFISFIPTNQLFNRKTKFPLKFNLERIPKFLSVETQTHHEISVEFQDRRKFTCKYQMYIGSSLLTRTLSVHSLHGYIK